MNLHDRTLIRDLLHRAVERFNASIDRETLLCPRTNDAMKSDSNWPAASERAIAHRLSFYLEHILIHEFRLSPEAMISVDCEYNRHGRAGKTQGISQELAEIVLVAKRKAVKAAAGAKSPEDAASNFAEFVISVAPDIVVHQRQVDVHNRLVVEVKKATNKEDPRYDDLKLKKFTDSNDYHYELGAAVVAVDNVAGNERCLSVAGFYEDGVRVWPKQGQVYP